MALSNALQRPVAPQFVPGEQVSHPVTRPRKDGLRDCPICGGDGYLVGDDDAEVCCDTCEGTGQVAGSDPASARSAAPLTA
jgi:hypothetical protein